MHKSRDNQFNQFNQFKTTPHIRVVLAPPLRTNFEICASVCNVSGFYGPSYIAALLFLDEGAFLAPSHKVFFKQIEDLIET